MRAVLSLGETAYLFKGEDSQRHLDINLYSLLTHTSIATLIEPFEINDIEGEERKQRERELWTSYVREMSIFYFDIFVEYVQALIQQGIYTIEDAQVFNEVVCKLTL